MLFGKFAAQTLQPPGEGFGWLPASVDPSERDDLETVSPDRMPRSNAVQRESSEDVVAGGVLTEMVI